MARRRPKETPKPVTPQPTEPGMTVVVTPEFREQADALPKPIQERVANAIERLRDWPNVSGVKRLKGALAGWYRMRTGDYRVRFRVQGRQVIVDKVGHRKDVYED
jgi:mRNA interferase RelE/StbE